MVLDVIDEVSQLIVVLCEGGRSVFFNWMGFNCRLVFEEIWALLLLFSICFILISSSRYKKYYIFLFTLFNWGLFLIFMGPVLIILVFIYNLFLLKSNQIIQI
jgi:hypothetical protein